jgi:hypothetical protein
LTKVGVAPPKARFQKLLQLVACQPLPAFGAWIVGKPASAAIARCRAVMSLNPISSLGLARIVGPIDQREDAGAAPSAAHREHGAHLRVGEGGVHVRGALAIGTGQIAVARHHMLADLGHQPHAGDGRLHLLHLGEVVAEARPARSGPPYPRRAGAAACASLASGAGGWKRAGGRQCARGCLSRIVG